MRFGDRVWVWMAVALLLGCAVASQVAAADVTIQFIGKDMTPAWEEAVRLFGEKQPGIQVEFLGNLGSRDWDKLTTMILGGVIPDVIIGSSQYTMPFILRGMMQELDPLLQRGDMSLRQFNPSIMEPFVVEGKVFGIPDGQIAPIAVNYNVDAFEQTGVALLEGLTPETWTWETLLQVGKKLTIDTDGDGVADRLGVLLRPDLSRFIPFVYQAGGRIFDNNIVPKEGRFLTPEMEYAVSFLTGLWTEHGIAHDSSSSAWIKGKVALTLSEGPWVAGEMNQAGNPFRWAVVPMPRGPVDNNTLGTLDGLHIAKGAKHPQAAWEWIRHVVSPEVQRCFMAERGRPSMVRGITVGDFVRALPGAPNSFYRVYIELAQAPGTFSYPGTPHWLEVRQKIANPVLKKMVAGEIAIKSGLAQIQQQTDALLK